MANSRYVLDSNVFIEAAKQYYAFDLAPGFWESLVAYAKSGEVMSIDRVKQELDRVKDGVTTWADSDFQEAFASTDETAVVQVYGRIVNWAQRQTRYSRSARAEFAQVADGWLVAYAKAKGCTVVTRESPLSREGRIKIPIVCSAFGVPCVSPFQMLRTLGVCFLDVGTMPAEESLRLVGQSRAYGSRFLKSS